MNEIDSYRLIVCAKIIFISKVGGYWVDTRVHAQGRFLDHHGLFWCFDWPWQRGSVVAVTVSVQSVSICPAMYSDAL